MNTKRHRTGRWLMSSALCIVCALVVIAGLTGPMPTASADLPPRPTAITPTSTPSPKPQEPAGAWIELRVQQPGSELPADWQQLWTAVQWQDIEGRWHDVEGWRGALDEVGNGVGTKVWWVAQKDFGTGPFRWVVHRGQGGEYLAESEPFTLPPAAGMTVQVAVLLAP